MSMQYVAGGTMLPQSGSYIVRDADQTLQEKLLLGEFCYVLTPRQMGKSSLMIHTAYALRERGISVAILDLSKQGYSLSSTQWYNGMLEMVGEQLGLDAEMEAYCRASAGRSPLQRWHGALREVVLEHMPGPVAIFVDEIDITRRLGFETDEFFAAIRACYNDRAEDPAYQRLTFCLMGVATPADLIRDPELTPFNIGNRIDLHDFTFTEAAALSRGLDRNERISCRLMERIYYWTSGHPYLTQRLCKAGAEAAAIPASKRVDRCCAEIYLDPRVRSAEDNLTFVSRRLVVDNAEHRAALLSMYQRILSGKRIADNDANPCVPSLKLSGVARAEDGRLIPRNRIYRTVFDLRWIEGSMPDAELRRQRIAFRRGVLRAAIASALVLLAIAIIGGAAALQYLHKRELAQQQEISRRYYYALGIDRAERALEKGNYPSAIKSLDGLRPVHDERDLRGFEWRLLWQQLQGDGYLIPCPDTNVFAVAVSPNGRLIAAGGQGRTGTDSTIRLWDAVTRRELRTFSYPGEVECLAFSPDGTLLAAGGGVPNEPEHAGCVELCDVTRGAVFDTLPSHRGRVAALAFSNDGKRLCVSCMYEPVFWWEIASHRVLAGPDSSDARTGSLALTPDNKSLAIGAKGQVMLYDLRSNRFIKPLPASQNVVAYALAFSPDNCLLAIGGSNGIVQVWDVKTWTLTSKLKYPDVIYSVACSPDSKCIACACWDGTVRIFGATSGAPVHRLLGHVSRVNSVAFMPDGKRLVSGANDGTVRFWDVGVERLPAQGLRTGGPVCAIALSDDGATLATTDGDKMVRLWDATSGDAMGTLPGNLLTSDKLRFSPDGRMLASVSWPDWNARLSEHHAAAANIDASALLIDASQPIVNAFAVTLQDIVLRRKTGGIARHISGVQCLALSPDGDTIAVIGPDIDQARYSYSTLEFWSLRSRRWLGAVRGAHANNVNAVAFTRDGKRIATGGWDHKVRIWDVSQLHGMQDGRPGHRTVIPQEFEDCGSDVYALAFTRDGRTMAVGTKDNKISLCNLLTSEIVSVLSGHKGAVTSLAFSHDDNLLVSGSLDGTVRFWRAAPFTRTDYPVRVNSFKQWKH